MSGLRRGASLLELCLALTLAGVAFAALLRSVVAFRTLAASQTERVALDAAWRLAAIVLGAELRAVEPAADLYAAGGDSIALRVFRGAGVVCGTAAGSVRVRYRGQRRPEPAKDSLLVVGEGAESVRGLAAVRSAADACAASPGDQVLELRYAGAPVAGGLVLVFERGSYHASDRALRYRRGDAGRQPLTGEVFARGGAVSLLSGDAGPAAVRVALPAAASGPAPRPGAMLRVAFLNALRDTTGAR